MQSTILFPFDGSPASLEALRRLARGSIVAGRKVLLVNVQSAYIDAELSHAGRWVADMYRREGHAILRPAIEALREAGVAYQAEVVFGAPAPTILRRARERGCELIVMGTRALHPLAEVFTRSVPSRVLRESPVPVMLVPRAEDVWHPVTPEQRAPWIAA